MDKPKLHLWETGVIRITRHPQCFGQFLWCAAHCLWIGNSFMITTSAGLMAHHLFSCWHGDFRQRRKYGEVGSQTLSSAFLVLLRHFAAAHSAGLAKVWGGGSIRTLHCCVAYSAVAVLWQLLLQYFAAAPRAFVWQCPAVPVIPCTMTMVLWF